MKNFLINSLAIGLILMPNLLQAQLKSDIAFLYSANQKYKLGLEYRTAAHGQYRMHIGFSYGTSFQGGGSDRILESSDSVIAFRSDRSSQDYYILRIGAERRIKSSPFSVSADVLLGYKTNFRHAYNYPYVLTDVGWRRGYFEEEEGSIEPNNNAGLYYPHVIGQTNFLWYKQHFFSPGLRLGLNMDLPINKAFYFHASAMVNVSVPIYMGYSKFLDETGTHFGSPPTIFDVETNLHAGVRYVIGSFKNRTRKTKG